MKRLSLVLALFALFTFSSGIVAAQDASPAASPASTPLLDGLNYPTLEVSYDGTALTAPTELAAGRYRLVLTNSSSSSGADLQIFGPAEGITADDLVAMALAVDPNSDSPPDWYFQVPFLGGTDNSSPAVVDVLPGEWVLGVIPFSDGSTTDIVAAQKMTVTGEMPAIDPIDGAVQVKLADMSIDMPATIPAGPTIFEVTNSGALPHHVWIMKTTGPITDAEAVNGVKMFFGMPDATPAAAGSAADPYSWSDVGGVDTIKGAGTELTELDMEPGTYIAFCFIEGPGDLGSHALAGMTTVFTVE